MSAPGASAAARGWSERLEPVLVKDLRAALRGKAFGVTLLSALAFLTAITLFVLVLRRSGEPAQGGGALLEGILWAAQVVMGGFVPLWTFLALGAELEGEAFDQLALSHLSPWRVVWGKFLAALVLLVLLACAALPFALFPFLLGGVDAAFVGARVLSAIVSGAEGCAAALCLSSLSRVRWVRAGLLGGLALALFWIHGPLLWYSLRTVTSGSALVVHGGSIAWWPILAGLARDAALCGVLLAFAGGRLAHPEQSRSTPLRAWSAVLAAALAFDVLVYAGLAGTGTLPLLTLTMRSAFPLLGLVAFLVCTEPEPLPRAARTPRARTWLRVPFLAGGGRGALLVLLSIGLLAGAALVLLRFAPGRAWSFLVVVAGLPCVYVLLPSGLLARWNKDARSTLRIRLAIAGGWVGVWAGCALVTLVTDGAFPATRLNLVDPGFLVQCFDDAGRCVRPVHVATFVVLALLGVLVNVPRVVRGAREVLALRAAPVLESNPGAPHAPPQP